MDEPLLEVDDLTIQYQTPSGPLTAVSNASFTIEQGEYFGLVGESGSGKTTILKSVLGSLDENGSIVSGSIRFRGQELSTMSEAELNERIRWKEISWIPQSSMNSLDPLNRIGDKAVELAKVHTSLTEQEALEQFRELFEIVGIDPERVSDYPHQFSGGMKQRAMIALALFLNPSLILADEPTTALDVIMQDQVFEYLDGIRDEYEASMMFITHDISAVFELCDNMAIMHAGQVAESGSVTEVYDDPRHPYSILLQNSFPDIRYPDRELEEIGGHPPNMYGSVETCTFADRCPWAIEDCRAHAPMLEPLQSADQTGDIHRAACIRKNEVAELYRAEHAANGGNVHE